MNPRLGIFLARDPWSGDAMRPGSMNGWNYTDGNPVNKIDPSGLLANPLAASVGIKAIARLAQLEDPSSNAGLRFGTLSHYQLAVRQEVVDVTVDFFMRHKDR
jgi:hypothetical protein